MPYHVGKPLLYAIDDWHQLPNAKSNTDPTLKIKVTDFVNSDVFQGVRVQVIHPQYGVLLSFMSNATGRLVSYDKNAFLTTNQILLALKQFGFDIRFKENVAVNPATFQFLQGAKEAGYTHVRWAIKYHTINQPKTMTGNCLALECARKHQRIVICFNENRRPELLNQYIPPIKEFGGDIMEVSPDRNRNLDFSWLDVPMHIDSVLTDNMKGR